MWLLCGCAAGYIWLFCSFFSFSETEFTVCPLKWIYGIPCPSCGSTRGLLALLHGEWEKAFQYNPNSYLLAVCLVAVPTWIGMDWVTQKDTLYRFYEKAEQTLRKKHVWIVLILLVLINWIWILHKGM